MVPVRVCHGNQYLERPFCRDTLFVQFREAVNHRVRIECADRQLRGFLHGRGKPFFVFLGETLILALVPQHGC